MLIKKYDIVDIECQARKKYLGAGFPVYKGTGSQNFNAGPWSIFFPGWKRKRSRKYDEVQPPILIEWRKSGLCLPARLSCNKERVKCTWPAGMDYTWYLPLRFPITNNGIENECFSESESTQKKMYAIHPVSEGKGGNWGRHMSGGLNRLHQVLQGKKIRPDHPSATILNTRWRHEACHVARFVTKA